MCDRFKKLYSRKVYVHHYLEYIPESMFTTSFNTLDSLNKEYIKLAQYQGSDVVQRYKPLF